MVHRVSPFRPAWRRSLLLAAVLQACQAVTPALADDFDDMRAKWLLRAAGGAAADTGDREIAAQLKLDDANAQRYWSTMQTAPDRAALWPDLASTTVSAHVTSAYRRLAAMAAVYASPHSTLRGNAALGAAVVDGLDWMSRHRYTAGRAAYNNWWDWQIGGPMALNEAVMAVRGLLAPDQLERCLAAIDFHVPDPAWRTNPGGTLSRTEETGANRLDKAFVAIMRGVNGKHAAKIAQGRDAISKALPYVSSGDGFYTDGSFVQHSYVSYIGGYGVVIMADVAALYYVLNGSPWQLADPNAGLPFDWSMQAYRPFIYDGAMMDMQRGRSISREFYSDHSVGRTVVGTMAELAQVLPPAQGAQLKAVLKGWMQRDRTFGASYFTPVATALPGIYAGLPAYQMGLLKALQKDAALAPLAEAVETRYYPATDRAVQRRPGHAFALANFSKRISSFESGNGENLRGWWTGVGTHYLYNADQTQFSGDFWPTVDAWRMPGTTTDHSGGGTPEKWKLYANDKAAVGGAELAGRHAAIGMDFSTSAWSDRGLQGKKAWFLFGDRVVAVGSAISATKPVETIVENRKLNADGSNALTVNGARQPATAGWSHALPKTKWAHLAGSVPGADIGYVFPDAPTVQGLRETRTGVWRDINVEGSTKPVSARYLSLALPHGASPTDGAYTFILLPNRSAAQVAAFAATNPVRVAERSASATAVTDSALGLTGLVFWEDAAKTVKVAGRPYLASDRKAAVVVQQDGAGLQLAVSDPTQENTDTIHLELHRSASAVLSHDPAITVQQLSPTIKLTVAVKGSAGKSYQASFKLKRP
ncbi:polysaccharide lyase 8 family protein [Massilia sp. Root418]|uniref:polysaccharide lyase 8 family protein n=1 Tax=Massilia sp. Root418 TaxID=1736532 RepID=UPI0006F91316|nr:polysaccharide lyase 8 family protein [Massilia sp. Root418]